MKKLRYLDYNFIAIIVLLICFGLVMLYSTSYYSAQVKFNDDMYYIRRQALFSLLSLAAMIVVSLIDYHRYEKLAVLFLIASWILMGMVRWSPFGMEINSARRWLKIPHLPQFQPSEIAKIAIVLIIPLLIVKVGSNIQRFKGLALVYLTGIATAGIVYFCTDHLSAALVILGMVYVMVLIVVKRPGLYVGAAAAGIAAAIAGAYILAGKIDTSESFRLRRLLVWVNPEKYADSGGYQILQGLYAIGSGGFFGKGLGNSSQKLGFIPESQNDMIMSIICEELGVFGVILLLLLFGFLLWRLVYIARRAPDLYGSLIAIGIFAHVAIQVVLNFCVVLNLIPTTGITLPFVSYGGTAIIFLMLEMGVALGISGQIKQSEIMWIS